MSYTLSSSKLIFINSGTGKDSGQQSTSRAIGVTISPNHGKSSIKMGLTLRATQTTIDIDGSFWGDGNIGFNDGVNKYIIGWPIDGSENSNIHVWMHSSEPAEVVESSVPMADFVSLGLRDPIR